MCRTLLLNASPNPDGHSMRLAMAVLADLPGECETVHLYQTAITPCLDCGCCSAGQPCPIADDMRGLVARVTEASVLLIASPLHFTSLTAPLIAFYSRLQPLWHRAAQGEDQQAIAGNLQAVGLAVTGGGEYKRMFEPARAVTASVCNSLRVRFAGMATAKLTDTLSLPDNPEALAEASSLAQTLQSALSK